jgi:hypothetical protein
MEDEGESDQLPISNPIADQATNDDAETETGKTGTTDGADLCRGKTVFDSPIVEDSAADCEADASRKDCHEAGP